MRENRTCGSEGGEAQSLPYPYPACPLASLPSAKRRSVPPRREQLGAPIPPFLPCRVQLGARAPTMACCQHGESPCGGYTLTPKSKLTASSRGGVGSKLR